MNINVNWGSNKYQEEKIDKKRGARIATFDRMVKIELSEGKRFEQRPEWSQDGPCDHLISALSRPGKKSDC